jgi:hypothetical protein
VSETPQQFVATILKDDRLADDGTQAGHAIAQPFGHSTTVERKICATGASRHQLVPSSGSTDAEVICRPPVLAASNSGSSSPMPADGC